MPSVRIAKVQRLHRQISAADGLQAVLRMPGMALDIVPVASPRFDHIMGDQLWSARVMGVFSPGVALAVLCSELGVQGAS